MVHSDEILAEIKDRVEALKITLAKENEKVTSEIINRIRKDAATESQDHIDALIRQDLDSITDEDVLHKFVILIVGSAVQSFSLIVHQKVQSKLRNHLGNDVSCRKLIEESLQHDRTWVLGSLGGYKTRAKRILSLPEVLSFCFLLRTKPKDVLPSLKETSDIILLNLMNVINARCPKPLQELNEQDFMENNYPQQWEDIMQLADYCLRYFEIYQESPQSSQF